MSDPFEIIDSSMERVEELLNQTFTDHVLETGINAMCSHVISAGGKRMRPRLLLLCDAALNSAGFQGDADKICSMAAAIELLHTATLIHDDVIDVSSVRRGRPTLNATEGNHAAVLAGDYMFTRCFALIRNIESFEILNALNHALRMLVTGELFQMQHEGDTSLSNDKYLETIYRKTGVLFELAAESPAIIMNLSQDTRQKLRDFGRCLGIAFQIRDDMLDYSSDDATLGKSVGIDLKDQRITLPVLLALKSLEGSERDLLLEAVGNSDFEAVRSAIMRTQSLEQCAEEARKIRDQAEASLDFLPGSVFKSSLVELCDKAISRNS